MLSAWLVCIRDYANPLASKKFRVLGPPPPGSMRVTGRHQVQRPRRLTVFFAFAYDDGTGRDQLGEAVKHPSNTVQLPTPAAFSIGPPLAKILRVKFHNLKEQLALLVAIGILCNNSSPSISILEQIPRLNSESR